MSEVYNPESVHLERLEVLELQARRLAAKLSEATQSADRDVIRRQLQETEREVHRLRRRAKVVRS